MVTRCQSDGGIVSVVSQVLLQRLRVVIFHVGQHGVHHGLRELFLQSGKNIQFILEPV